MSIKKSRIVFGFINQYGEFILKEARVSPSSAVNQTLLNSTLMADFYGLEHIKSRVKYNFSCPGIFPHRSIIEKHLKDIIMGEKI